MNLHLMMYDFIIRLYSSDFRYRNTDFQLSGMVISKRRTGDGIYPGILTWGDVTVQEFIEVLDTYLKWYSTTRIKMSLGAMSPMEYRRSLGLIA